MDKYDELGIKLLASSLKPGGIFAGLIDDMLGFNNKSQSNGADNQPVVTDDDQMVVPPLDC
ncbi:MAG: hypothetical protein K2X29_13685 [Candidatus Obscuribacterales bacterium]|nr:hypothetical protein [Candidatus Obscuribacterales bacterium]